MNIFLDATGIAYEVCDSFALPAKLATNYAIPFSLSMTISTSSSHTGPGNIFSDRIDSNYIGISWRDNSSLVFIIKISEELKLRETDKLNKSQNYDVKLLFDGTHCLAHLDGQAVGSPIDCSSGLGSEGSPVLCHSNIYGSWLGTISNLHFENFKGEIIEFICLQKTLHNL